MIWALALPGVCWAQLERPALDRLFQSVESAHRAISAADWGACLAKLDETAPLARRAWVHTSISWFGVRLRCEARALQGRGEPLTDEVIGRLASAGVAHFAHVPPGVERRTGARMQFLRGKWDLMRDLGLGEEANREERETVQSVFDAVEAGLDPAAREDLDRWAGGFYGLHEQLPQIQSHLRWVTERYGQAHRAALLLRRAVSFAYRSADRSAEALSAMDEAAGLAKQHHPSDVDLQMYIAGERAPCLADNGQLLEARDEFITLRDWMLSRLPLDHSNLMRMNYHLAAIANKLGDHDQAEAFADAADRHAQQSPLPNDRVEVSVAHLQRAEARMLRGVPGAVDEVRQELERNHPADGGTGAPAFGLAKLAQRTGDADLLAWAQDFLQRHAHERLQPLQPSRALVEIAEAWASASADPARARVLLERALTRSLSERDLSVSIQASFAMARQLAPRQPDAAVWWFKRGANALQALRQRGGTEQDDSMHRATLVDHEADLREFIALLIDEGRYLEAREALRVLREEELHDFTRRSRRRAVAARAPALAFNAQERDFEMALKPLADRMVVEQSLADARAMPAPLETRGKGWLNDPVTEGLLDRTQGELHALLVGLATRSPGSAVACGKSMGSARDRACRADKPLPKESGRELLPPATARLQYFVRESRLEILITTALGWHRHSVPITRVDLNRRVHSWRAALVNPGVDATHGAREFHALMIEPVQAQLRRVRHLWVSLDGTLRYLPLAALNDGHRFLVQRFNLVLDDGIPANRGAESPGQRRSTTAAMADAGPGSRLGPMRANGVRLAAFGRTAPDDEHAALPGVEMELKTLADLGDTRRSDRPPVRVHQDQQFTARALQDALELGPSVVHIASHFHLAAAEEESSYLLLGDGARLPLARLAQMPWGRVRVVLLSACDSAVGETTRHGREFSGLAGVLRQAGAENVLASLWPIPDSSTAAFMSEFYRPWVLGGIPDKRSAGSSARQTTVAPDASWLAQAQRRWLARHPSGSFAHPYHWASFGWWGAARNVAQRRFQ